MFIPITINTITYNDIGFCMDFEDEAWRIARGEARSHVGMELLPAGRQYIGLDDENIELALHARALDIRNDIDARLKKLGAFEKNTQPYDLVKEAKASAAQATLLVAKFFTPAERDIIDWYVAQRLKSKRPPKLEAILRPSHNALRLIADAYARHQVRLSPLETEGDVLARMVTPEQKLELDRLALARSIGAKGCNAVTVEAIMGPSTALGLMLRAKTYVENEARRRRSRDRKVR